MALSKKKNDLISERARALNSEIAALEAQIKQLDSQLQKQEHPRLRSTAIPHGGTIQRAAEASKSETRSPKPETSKAEPIFEEVDKDRLQSPGEVATPEHYNELGVRKYDLPALIERIKNHFRGPTTTNPKLVSYLAAGGVQGLRPLRYEKRVARNRFIALAVFLFVILLGLILAIMRRH